MNAILLISGRERILEVSFEHMTRKQVEINRTAASFDLLDVLVLGNLLLMSGCSVLVHAGYLVAFCKLETPLHINLAA